MVSPMNGSAFKDIDKLEADLWSAADNLRANSKLTSSDYFMPVLDPMFQQLGLWRRMNEKLRAARDLLLPRLMKGEVAI